MPNLTAAIQLCVQKLRILIEDSDQNLKYLGLLVMGKILKTNPKSVQGHKDLIMQCLDDSDDSIRLRALDLLYGMVSRKNLMEIVKKLMTHMDKAEGTTYRDELMYKIVQICQQNGKLISINNYLCLEIFTYMLTREIFHFRLFSMYYLYLFYRLSVYIKFRMVRFGIG